MRRHREASRELGNDPYLGSLKDDPYGDFEVPDSDKEGNRGQRSPSSDDNTSWPSKPQPSRSFSTGKTTRTKLAPSTPQHRSKQQSPPAQSPTGNKALVVAKKLGFQGDQTKDYTDWIANLKEEFITGQHPEIVVGPKQLHEDGHQDVWQTAVQDFVDQEPRFKSGLFSKSEATRAAHELLRNQVKKLRLNKKSVGGLGSKRSHEVLEDRPQTDQAIVSLDLSKLPSPNFTIALWRTGFSMPFLSQISQLTNIKDLQDWVCTKLGIPLGAAMIEAVFPVYNETFLDILGVTESGSKARLDVSDQASWNSVVPLAQQVAKDPAKFAGLRLEARKGVAEELGLRWNGRRPAEEGPITKRLRTTSEGGDDDSYQNGQDDNDTHNDEKHNSKGKAAELPERSHDDKDLELASDAPPEEEEEDEDDPVVEGLQMQGIIGTFHEKEAEKPPVDLNIFLSGDDDQKDQSDPRHREENNPGGLGEGHSTTNENEFFGLCTKNYNNDFEHECFDQALSGLNAKAYDMIPADGGVQRFSIPGCGSVRYYPHQVWGIQFVVQRIINEDGLNSCLVADDMGMGKTFVALGSLYHLKWLVAKAAKDRPLPCCAGRRPSEIPEHNFFNCHLRWAERPTIIIVPPSLLNTWVRVLMQLPEGFSIVVLHGSRKPTAKSVNADDERNHKIYLTSYQTWRARYNKSLQGARFGIGIFDESHHVKNSKTMIFDSLVGLNCKYKIQLSGTPMHHAVSDWVVQARWLHKGSESNLLAAHGYQRMAAAIDIVKKDKAANDASYAAIRDCVYPWTIRRWAETTLADGKPLINIPELVTENVTIHYTEEEAEALDIWVKEEKERTAQKYNSALHGWRLASFHGDLVETERQVVEKKSVFRTEWDKATFKGSPIFRWLKNDLIPLLTAAGESDPPHKAVLFAPLPAQTYLVNWWFKTYFSEIECYHFKATLNGGERVQLLEAFDVSKKPGVLIITPALGGNGINLICADHLVILQKFWNMNEQKQAMARIHRIGQKRKPKAFILHTKGGIDDRITELQMANGRFEARVMHGLMGKDLTYEQILNTRTTRQGEPLKTQPNSISESKEGEDSSSEDKLNEDARTLFNII